MDFLSSGTEKISRCREVAISRGSTVVFQENKDGD